MPEFRTKEEVDEWYEKAMDGLGRAGAYLIANKKPEQTSAGTPDYLVAVRALANVKKHLYREMGMQEEPKLISWRDTVERHYGRLL